MMISDLERLQASMGKEGMLHMQLMFRKAQVAEAKEKLQPILDHAVQVVRLVLIGYRLPPGNQRVL